MKMGQIKALKGSLYDRGSAIKIEIVHIFTPSQLITHNPN